METRSITDYLQTLDDIIPALQLGILPDYVGTVYHKFAESATVTTTASILSSFTNPDPFNESGLTLYLSSSSIADTQSIYIEGILHSDGTITSETKNLNGQTAVQLTNVYRTILRAYNSNGTELVGTAWIGSEANPALGIPATLNAYAHIPNTFQGKVVNQTLSSVFTIPAGYTGYITNWYGTATKGKDVELIAYSRPPGGIFRYQERMFNFESSMQKKLPFLKFVSGTDFKVMAKTSTGTVDGSCSYDFILLKSDFIGKTRPLAFR